MADTCKLTIYFDDPFWVALVETEENGQYRVARHVFGPEPTDPQIEEFIHDNWRTLHFTDALQVEKKGGKRINPKRMRRIIEKEIAANAVRGTKAQQALAEQREAHKLEKRAKSKEQKEAETERKFQQRAEKRKQKHRGH
ncbi:MAG: YjdF family protein [Eggerthellales bacterium]|nr:YjdF family protein [Eggerthellales bacterium]